MSLLDFLSPQAQAPGAMSQPSGLARILQPEIALPMAAALLGNQGNAANFGNAFGAAGQGLQAQKSRQEELAQQNRTLEYFKQNAPEFAEMVASGMPVGEAWKTYTEQRYAKPARNDYAERREAAEQYGLTGDDATSFVLTGQLPTGRFGSAEVGLSPIPVYDDRGQVRLYQPTKSGTPVEMQFPEGYRPMSPFDTSYQKSSGVAAGKGQGEAQELYQSMTSKMPGLRSVVGQLDQLSEKATYTLGGQALDWGMRQTGMEPREAAVAREQYIAMVNNQILPMLRDTFGAQFTVQEGESLKATLGAPDKSPKEKQAVLKAFIEQKERDIAALAQRAGQPVAAPETGVVDYTDYFGGQ